MAESIFTQIYQGKIPGEIVYQDEWCFVVLTNQPAHPGHLLVIPINEVDHFDDADDKELSHLMVVAKKMAKILKTVYHKPRVRLIIDGFGVPHVHLHLIPVDKGFEETVSEICSGKRKLNLAIASEEELRTEADKIRHALQKS